MAHKVADRARETSTAPGTGAMVLNGAVQGGQTFASFLSNADTTFVTATNGTAWQTGNATYASAGNSLTFIVDVDFRSSNANAAVNFSSGTVDIFCDAGAVVSDSLFHPRTPGGRLTLTTAVPVLTATVSAAGTIYYALYTHNQVPLYNGTAWTNKVITELSNVLANSATGKAGPAAVTTNSNYDLFVWNDAGTVRLTRGPLWTSGTARGTGAGTTELVRVEGIWLNAVAITNGPAAQRGTYVGTVRTNGTSTVDWTLGSSAAGGGAAFLHVWNVYNRTLFATTVIDSTTAYTYNSATFRSANASTGNRISFVMGLAIDRIVASYSQLTGFAASTSAIPAVGFGMDSTTVTDKRGLQQAQSTTSAVVNNFVAPHPYAPQIGSHFIQALEAELGAQNSGFNQNSLYGGLTIKTMM